MNIFNLVTSLAISIIKKHVYGVEKTMKTIEIQADIFLQFLIIKIINKYINVVDIKRHNFN